jgi:hypothetical protein
MRAGDLDFKDNIIKNYAVNGGIELNPNGTGFIDIYANTTVNGNITVTGNTQINGNLTEATNIIVGDSILDTVIIAPDFTQSIIPGDNITYDLGTSIKRWGQIHVRQNLDIGSLTFNDVTVGLQLEIESGLPSIRTLQSNDDVILNSDTAMLEVTAASVNEAYGFPSSPTQGSMVTTIPWGSSYSPLAIGWTGLDYYNNLRTITGFAQSITPSGLPSVPGYPYQKTVITFDGPFFIHNVPEPQIFTFYEPTNSGIVNIERIRFQGNQIINLDATALTLTSTGIGYVRFMDNNGLVIPAGTDAQRSASPETGDTRWNTDNPIDNYMECFDGTTWNLATGPGGSISSVENYDLANAYILILG